MIRQPIDRSSETCLYTLICSFIASVCAHQQRTKMIDSSVFTRTSNVENELYEIYLNRSLSSAVSFLLLCYCFQRRNFLSVLWKEQTTVFISVFFFIYLYLYSKSWFIVNFNWKCFGRRFLWLLRYIFSVSVQPKLGNSFKIQLVKSQLASADDNLS